MDPSKRLSCEQLLEHPYFDSLINEKREETKISKNPQQSFQQNQNMIPKDRNSKPPGVRYFF